MRQRKSGGSRRRGLGKPRGRRRKKRRRRGYTSRRSLLHGSDGKVKYSKSIRRQLTPQEPDRRTVGGKEATHDLLTTLQEGRARMHLHREFPIPPRGMIRSTVYEETQTHCHCTPRRPLLRSPHIRNHRPRTLLRSEHDGSQCFPRLPLSCR